MLNTTQGSPSTPGSATGVSRVSGVESTRPLLSRTELEARRMKAVALVERGERWAVIGRRLGISRTTVSRWRAAHKAGGAEGLKRRTGSGRPRRLDRSLVPVLWRDGMTAQQLTEAIERSLGVRYDPDHVLRIMHELNLPSKYRTRRSKAAAVQSLLRQQEPHEGLTGSPERLER